MEEQKKIEIPEVIYQGDDKILKERIFKFKAGSFRIAVFTLVGFFMGVASHNYVGIGFFPMKLIMAIPYKACEAIYVSVIGTDADFSTGHWAMRWTFLFTEFFPHSRIATFLAENVTTVLIGGAIYGSLAYFTGDSRVFTLRRFLKFAAAWCGVILLSVGASYLVNAKAIQDNESLKGASEFYLINSTGHRQSLNGTQIKEYFYSELEAAEIERDQEKELVLGVIFDHLRYCSCLVNYERQYLVTEQGKIYHISEEFAQVIREYEEKGFIDSELFDGEAAEEAERGSFAGEASEEAERDTLGERELGDGTEESIEGSTGDAEENTEGGGK